MRVPPLKTRLRSIAALVCCLCVVACGSLNSGNTGPPFRDPTMSMQTARGMIVVGKTTQTDVKEILGPATNIQFESGNVLWVYRTQTAQSETDRAELVILFDPSGLVKKTRLRPVYAGYGR